jgi:serine protease Do
MSMETAAKNVMDQLRTSGKVTRAQLGVTVQTVTSDMAASLGLKEQGGVIVSGVTSGSPADHAGLKQGDVITTFAGQPVHDMNTLRNRVAASGPGSNADVTFVRDGSEKHATVRLEALTPETRAK